ncbi:MAG: hypothetical protein QOE90_1445 [Thermoplasmata archaeon]|jgi:hypothetical protein|nr:hypothetical protein [Thermoplasmata archaeon]
MAAKKAAAKKAAPKKAAPKKTPAKKAAAPQPQRQPKPSAGPQIPARTFVIPHDAYEANKDAIKAPMKARGMKWSYLGEDAEGKRGIYRDDAINVFAHFMDDGVHYTLRGKDQEAADGLLSAWRGILSAKLMDKAKEAGQQAAAQEQAQQESEAVKLWRLQEPQRRPGEPDFFYDKRVAEWKAQKPTS